jgi:FkbM family methyltransferase
LDLREVVDFATYFGGWEPETIAFIDRCVKRGDVVIEVGANVGIQTLQIARQVAPDGRVYAFEPTAFALDKLSRNLALNPDLAECVKVQESLVTDHALAVPVQSIRSSYQTDQRPKVQDQIVRPEQAISLDDFVELEGLSVVHLLKIDVDGYELKVLKGACRTILKFRPRIYVELDEHMLRLQGDSVAGILSMLSSWGYEGFFALDRRPIRSLQELLEYLAQESHINCYFDPGHGAPAQGFQTEEISSR